MQMNLVCGRGGRHVRGCYLTAFAPQGSTRKPHKLERVSVGADKLEWLRAFWRAIGVAADRRQARRVCHSSTLTVASSDREMFNRLNSRKGERESERNKDSRYRECNYQENRRCMQPRLFLSTAPQDNLSTCPRGQPRGQPRGLR